MIFRVCTIIGFITLVSLQLFGKYSISGHVNMSGQWQYQIYLSTIDKLDDYYNANAKYIVNSSQINKDGKFTLTGDNLPSESQFYRLYVIKEEHSEFNACLYVGGEEHNFIHLILDNDSKLVIESDLSTYAPFGDYFISGDPENKLMKNLARLILPSYNFYEIKFPSELQFSQIKLNKDLFNFADTCSSILVSLAAINNTDFDSYFDTHFNEYNAFGKRLKDQIPNHLYTSNYYRKLRYYRNDKPEDKSNVWIFSTLLLTLLSAFLSYRLLQIKQRNLSPSDTSPALDIQLTKQEHKVLDLIIEGKSNKEIASNLYIEVSTVKSHINNLFSKIGVSNRNEAILKSKDINT